MSKHNYSQEKRFHKVEYTPEGRAFDGAENSLRKRSHFILPPPAILEAYEKLSEGATEKLLAMAEEEQQHRHEWEDHALRAYIWSNRLGKVFGSFVALAVVFASVYLAILGDTVVASTVAVSGFLSLTISSLVTLRARKFERKPRKLREKNSNSHENINLKKYN